MISHEAAGEMRLLDLVGASRLPRRIDLDQLVEIDRQRMPGDLRLVGQQGRRHAGLAQQRGQPGPRLRRRGTHGVPSLPVRTVQSLQLRASRPAPARRPPIELASRSKAGVSIHVFP